MSNTGINTNCKEEYTTIGNLFQPSRGRILIEQKKDDLQDELNSLRKKRCVNGKLLNDNTNELQKKIKISSVSFVKDCQVGWSILGDDGLGPYNITLNLTDPSINKFVVLQVLKKDEDERCGFLERWGEVDVQGKPLLYNGTLLNGTKASMINSFCLKFTEITGYQYMGHVDYENYYKHCYPFQVGGNDINCNGKYNFNNVVELKLHGTVKRIVETLFDKRNMTKVLQGMNLNLKRMPLSNLSRERITSGYECLQNIEISIMTEDKLSLAQAVGIYYQTIPRSFGINPSLKLIETMDELEKETEFLDTLWEIQSIMEIIKDEVLERKIIYKHIIDSYYEKMRYEIELLSVGNSTRATIIDVFMDSQLYMDTLYKINVRNIFEIKSKTKIEEISFHNILNKKLLWYGTKITNWYDIFSRGLRILPKDSFATVSMFDSGVYMTDVSLSSIEDFRTVPGETSFIGIVEAVVGFNCVECHVHNRGSRENICYPENEEVTMPIEESTDQSNNLVVHPSKYIIYNKDQVRIRYLVEIEVV